MDYTVTHVTRFDYQAPVHESAMEVRLSPPSDERQQVQSFELGTDPAAALFRYTDAFGNEVHHFDIVAPHVALVIETHARVRTLPPAAPPDRLQPAAWDALARKRSAGELWDFFEPSDRVPASPSVQAFADRVAREADPLTCWRGIVAEAHRALVYAPGSTGVDTSVETVLETRRGVCQDFAHVVLAVARRHGIPCRYVSGYLVPAGAPSEDQPLTTHAWVEAWLPEIGWTPLDPTHDAFPDEHYVSVAVGRDYGDAAPTRGVFRGGPAGALSTSVRIARDEGPAALSETRTPLPVVVPAPPSAAARHDQ